MAAMALEYIFKVLILTVVSLVVISFVYSIVSRSEKRFSFCIAPFCKPQVSACETKLVEKDSIDEYILNKYLNLCLENGRSLKKNCVCYTIKLNIPFDTTTISFPSSVVDECGTSAKTFLIEYRFGEDKVHLLC